LFVFLLSTEEFLVLPKLIRKNETLSMVFAKFGIVYSKFKEWSLGSSPLYGIPNPGVKSHK